MNKEIERKFLIAKIDETANFFEDKEIHQNYLSVQEDEELRIRLENDNNQKTFTLTHKKGKGLTRIENETRICEAMYCDLTEKTQEVALIKNRKATKYGDYIVVVDTYGPEFNHMMTAEVEFENEEEARAFKAPSWFGEDVTEDSTYKNKNLWKTLQTKLNVFS